MSKSQNQSQSQDQSLVPRGEVTDAHGKRIERRLPDGTPDLRVPPEEIRRGPDWPVDIGADGRDGQSPSFSPLPPDIQAVVGVPRSVVRGFVNKPGPK